MKSWSPYQTAIFAAIAAGKNIVVRAAAGSGKSTTIVEGLKHAHGTTLFLAFNKAIAEELKARGVNARTFHSLTYSAVTRFAGTRNVDSDKVRNHLRATLDGDDYHLYGAFVQKLVAFAKNAGVGILLDDIESNWDALADRQGLELDSDRADWATAIELARKTLQWNNQPLTGVDFDDLLYFAVLHGISLQKFDVVLVDEAQDTNAIQRAILRKLGAKQIVAVGDEAQAIYGFRGADSDALDLIAKEFGAEFLPLTVSYRCATKIVEHAQQHGTIEAAPGAIEGVVRTLVKTPDAAHVAELQAGDLVVARCTKPLIEAAYLALRQRKAVHVMGREIGAGLISLIKKQQAKGVEALVTKLTASTEREIERAVAKGDDAKAERAQDRLDTILFLIDALPENQRTVPELIRTIEELFADKANATTFATIHKSKGLEAGRVFWLNYDYVCKWARQDWQKQQETNLRYVAATRAKNELILIPEGTS